MVALAGGVVLGTQPEKGADAAGLGTRSASASPAVESAAASQPGVVPFAPSPTAAPATPSPSVRTTGWVRLRNGPDGYEVAVPSRFGTPSRPHPGVISYHVEDGRPFTISVGEPSGVLYVCGQSCVASTGCQATCQPIGGPVRTLDDLQELLVSVPDPMGMARHRAVREIHADSLLGGGPARVESVARTGWLLGPPAYHRVFAVHDGRPVVLTFYFWSTRNGDISPEEVAGIVSSFRFLDDETGRVRLQSHVNRADGYRVDLPPAWIETEAASTMGGRS